MKPIQRVVWSEGMLVSPQHMQQQDLYHERLLDERIAALSPYRWGVVAVEIDAGALGSGQLRVTKFVGVLPDGLYLSFEGKEPESPPTRPLADHFPPTQAICEVFLGVQKEREGVPSMSIDEGAAGSAASSTKAARARFRATTRPVADLTGNAAELAMSFARRNVVVLFGDEPRDDYDVIKIAELVRDGTGAFLNGEAYIPPVLRVDASPFLMAGIRRLLALMVAKQRQLAGNRNQRGGASIEFNAGDVTRFLQLSTVNGGIPILAYAAANGEISPTQLYLAVIQVVGQLATFSPDVEPWGLPAFAHTDLRGHVRGAVRPRDRAPAHDGAGGLRERAARAQSVRLRRQDRRRAHGDGHAPAPLGPLRDAGGPDRPEAARPLQDRLAGTAPAGAPFGGDTGRSGPGHPPAPLGDRRFAPASPTSSSTCRANSGGPSCRKRRWPSTSPHPSIRRG